MDATDRERIIAKVKKCLALARSSNEHEAATALRQAQKLMDAHGISDLDVEHAAMQEASTRAGAVSKPALWEVELAGRVARAFDCVVFLLSSSRAGGRWVFVGATPAGEIARYAFEVLFRQAKRARAHYLKTTLKRCTKTRTRRADLFCEGWVLTATALVVGFVGNEAAQTRARAYLEDTRKLTTGKTSNRTAGRALSTSDYADMLAGNFSGKAAQLNRGLGGAGTLAALGVER